LAAILKILKMQKFFSFIKMLFEWKNIEFCDLNQWKTDSCNQHLKAIDMNVTNNLLTIDVTRSFRSLCLTKQLTALSRSVLVQVAWRDFLISPKSLWILVNLNQTLVEWYLDGPLPKLCPMIPIYNQDDHTKAAMDN
jgi:hypothetical protein